MAAVTQIKDLDSCSTITIYSTRRTLSGKGVVQNHIIQVFSAFPQYQNPEGTLIWG
jgi:hypothetical protein